MDDINREIEQLLGLPPYGVAPNEKLPILLTLLRREIEAAVRENPALANYVSHWPVSLSDAVDISDLPFIPAASFKTDKPLSLVTRDQIKMVIESSSTSGQMPSQVVLDVPTVRRTHKAVTLIAEQFVGRQRRPYLIVDTIESMTSSSTMGARGAAIQGFLAFSTDVRSCLRDINGHLTLDGNALDEFVSLHSDNPVLIFGFTYVLWKHFITPLLRDSRNLGLRKAIVLHSGGWKGVQSESVDKRQFIELVSQVVGCSRQSVIDVYGMVENVGVIYPDCENGNKHVPTFAEIVVRDPVTLAPVIQGGRGIVQTCSVLPTSFPGQLILTDDLGEMVAKDGCPCGRRGTAFRFLGRVPDSEPRGCGDIVRERSRGY